MTSKSLHKLNSDDFYRTQVYSCPSLEWPNTEDPFSRPFVGQYLFRLVLLNRMNIENVIGYFFFYQLGTFPLPHTCTHPLFHGHFQQAVYGWKWILISAPEPCEHRECCGVFDFAWSGTFECPTHTHSIRSSMGISNRICSKAGRVDFSAVEKSTWPAFEQILLEIPMEERMLCACVGQRKELRG